MKNNSAVIGKKKKSLIYTMNQQEKFIDTLFNVIDFKSYALERKQFVMENAPIQEHDYFLVSKHQIVEENVLFTSKKMFELLSKEQHIDELFLSYAEHRSIELNLNMERILYLSLTLLFSLNLIQITQNMIKRN